MGNHGDHRKITMVIVRGFSLKSCRSAFSSAKLRNDYHFVITSDGKLIKGRPLFKPATVAPGRNRHSIIIAFDYAADNSEDILKDSPNFTVLMKLLNNLKFQYRCPVTIERVASSE